MAKRGRPELTNAARHILAFRVRASELDRLQFAIEKTGEPQSEILRTAIVEFLDRHFDEAPSNEKSPVAR